MTTTVGTASGLVDWLSNDPIGISGGLNQYVFCGNDPVNFTDPFGLWTLRIGVFGGYECCVAGNANIGVAIGYSKREGFTLGLVGGAGGGAGAVVSAGVGGFIEWTNAAEVDDLCGASVQIGGSGTFGPGFGGTLGGDYIKGIGSKWQPTYGGGEFNFGIGGGLPLGGHVVLPVSFAWATNGKTP